MTTDRRGYTRRHFTSRLGWHAFGLLALWSGLGARRAAAATPAPPERESRSELPVDLLERSPFVYISPLQTDGSESRCHGELWYAWLDGSVVVTVARDGWKARALARGLDRARVWVGDHGRWKTWYGGRNESFRAAPHFEARVTRAEQPGLLDRVLDVYERKYPDEIADWRGRMRAGNADGSRILLRYTPILD